MTQQEICDAINKHGRKVAGGNVGPYATVENLPFFSELFVADCLRAAREARGEDA